MKNNITTVLVILLVGVGVFFIIRGLPDDTADVDETIVDTVQLQNNEQENDTQITEQDQEKVDELVIGKSVEGREIIAHYYGTGDTEILFIGGIHGGYSWNTALVAYEMMDYLETNPDVIPNNVRVTVVPVLNPDGLYRIFGTTTSRFAQADVQLLSEVQTSGRFNANEVDLNRNFDCNWKSVGTWRKVSVSGGSETFSEPESLAIRTYVEMNNPTAIIVWFSSADGVFSSSCNDGILPDTVILNNLYSKASGYPSYESFDFYETTGDMVNWFAKKNIPAISVLLSTHKDTEWIKNQAGIEALLNYYAE